MEEYVYNDLKIDWKSLGSKKEVLDIISEYIPNGTFDVISFQKDYPELLTEKEALEYAGGATYDGNPIALGESSDRIWWVQWIDGRKGKLLFTIDKENFYDVFADYGEGKCPEDVKKIFDEEYPFWKSFFFGKDKASAKLHKVQFKKKANRDVEVYGGPGSGRYPKGSGKNPQASKREKKQKKEIDSRVNMCIEHAKIWKIDQKEVKKVKEPLTEDQIIKKVSGLDGAGGACVSQAMAYVANKMGYDVLDYRGGDSRDYFSENFLPAFSIFDQQIYEGSPSNSEKLKEEAFSSLKEGTEYVCNMDSHCAIVRKNEEGQIQYLELQRADSGWKDMDYTRFGDSKIDRICLNEISELDEEEKEKFAEICTFINTDEKDRKIRNS